MQNGTNANNIKTIFFITVGFYLLPPALDPLLTLELLLLEEELLGLLTLELLLLEEELLGLLTLELLLLEEELLGLLTLELLLLEEELLGLLTLELLLLEEELLGLLTLELLLLEEELLGLTYSELERTWRLLLAGVYDLRSEDADDDGLVDDVLEGRDAEDGLTALEGRVLLLAGRALLDGLSLTLEAGANPADAGLWVLPATCKPPCPLGRGFGAGARPPPGCGLLG